jgi:hypothetical protein
MDVRLDMWATVENQARYTMMCQWYDDSPQSMIMKPLTRMASPVTI